jgi:hypothetical protein
MKIAFDIDGVVLNSIEYILEHINRVKGSSHTTADLLSWELERLGIDSETLWNAVDYMYEQPRIEPYEGAADVLSRIHRATGEPLLFITGRRDPHSARRQLEALEWNPTLPRMIVTGGTRDKRAYLSDNRVDLIIEDDVEYAQHYLNVGIGVGVMLRPWNSRTTIPVTKKFRDWAHLGQWFDSLSG